MFCARTLELCFVLVLNLLRRTWCSNKALISGPIIIRCISLPRQ